MKLHTPDIELLKQGKDKLIRSDVGSSLCVIIGEVDFPFADSLFCDEDTVNVLPPCDLPNLLKWAGFFESASEARKNGWNGKVIPVGWSEWKVKKAFRLFILKS